MSRADVSSVFKDHSFIPVDSVWPPQPWHLPPASWQTPAVELQGTPWQPPLPLMADPPPPAQMAPLPMPMSAQPAQNAPPIFGPEQNMPSSSDLVVVPSPALVVPVGAIEAPPVQPEVPVAPLPTIQPTLCPSGAPPSTPPSLAISHPLPPRPVPNGLNSDAKNGTFQNGKNFHQRSNSNNSWRRKSADRPPASMFGTRQNDESVPTARFPPAPWANHHKFAGGVAMPISPPWETVPLRGQGNSIGCKKYHSNDKGHQRDWCQVDGGFVANDGSVIQQPGIHRGQHVVRGQFGFIDPCNLIVRVSPSS